MAHPVLHHPFTTEKAVRVMEKENKLLFRVGLNATKSQIKAAVQETFGVKVLSVNTLVTVSGQKRAYVKLDKQNPAMDIITKLGLM